MAETDKATSAPTAETAAGASPDREPLDEARKKLRQVAGQVQERYQKVSADVKRGAERAATEIKGSAERAGAELRQGAGRAGAAAREKIDLATENLREGYGRMRRDAEAAAQDLNEYVKRNPGRSIAIASAVGFVIGLLFRGRRGD